jgi:hypothetical protein
MLRRLSLLFVGVLAAVGVSVPALASASTTRVSKEWPPVGVLLTAAVTALFAWVLLFGSLSSQVLGAWVLRGITP